MKRNKIRKILAIIIPVIVIVGSGFIYIRFTEPKAKVGVLNIDGEISSFKYANLAEEAIEDSSIKAVVLKINSAGGTVTGTFQTEHSVSKLAKEKPVIANLEELAASGAYVVASAADNIYAYEHTVTAGLGVIAMWVDYENYFEEKGIKYHIWKTGEQKDMFAPWRGPSEEENAYIQELVENFEIELYNRITQNRPETTSQIDTVKDGSTVYGSTALQLNLVDEIGNHEDAVKEAAKQAGLKKGKYKKVNLSNYFEN
ncbi:hypothetical protein AKJ39_00860 [candidate division MSBL1 archaeon SCGC-AAA259J03]|uniref:Peptidase S49 domain-containing protein n=2 Tax=candidate division MSBL1 TaxID=215777 RepID=A0A656YX68_9EURY|nr:hypothetical protein AKJ61_00970 [candidate division MSBL1 archaeon SCGC-AAA259B11]KXA98772.1 hypothetical protein AKJ39_00860 [candidate division MSBL1 archaeon SCGC-AAA259J03]